MKCKFCGNEMNDSDLTCSSCGAKNAVKQTNVIAPVRVETDSVRHSRQQAQPTQPVIVPRDRQEQASVSEERIRDYVDWRVHEARTYQPKENSFGKGFGLGCGWVLGIIAAIVGIIVLIVIIAVAVEGGW